MVIGSNFNFAMSFTGPAGGRMAVDVSLLHHDNETDLEYWLIEV